MTYYGIDLFTLEYVVVADYYFKYPFVRQIPRGQGNSHTVMKMLRPTFSGQGIPKLVGSDNGPYYSSQAFQDSAREPGFQHVTSSPHYSRSNGFIESQLRSVKAALLKAKTTQREPDMALQCLRTPPIDLKLP